MDRPCLPAIHFLLLPGVDAANFLGDLLRQFSLDEHRSGHYNSRVTYRNELTKLSEEERANFRKYMEDEFCQYGDLLTVVEVAEAIGYCDTSLHRWCNAKKLKSFNISGRFLIPKISLVDFLVSQYSFDITRKTWKHTLLIKGFLDRLDTTE